MFECKCFAGLKFADVNKAGMATSGNCSSSWDWTEDVRQRGRALA